MPSTVFAVRRISLKGWSPLLIPTLFIMSAFLCGVGVFVVRNRADFALIMTQFPALWAVQRSRWIMLVLLGRAALTGIIISALALACLLMRAVLKQSHEQIGDVQSSMPQPVQSQENVLPQSVERPTTSPQSVLVADEPRGTQKTPLHVHVQLPVTPIPPTFSPEQETVLSLRESGEQERQSRIECGDKVLVAEEQRHEESTCVLEIRVLKDVQMNLYLPELDRRYPVKLDELTPKARHLIAYMSWHKADLVRLDTLRTHVFGSEEADSQQVQDAFSTAKRDIRNKIEKAANRANKEAGKRVVPDDLDCFALLPGRQYALTPYCHVTDLMYIEAQHQFIDEAETSNQLVNSVPQNIMDACLALIQAYKGDFMEDLLDKYKDAVDPWVESWAREPFTQYREYYLQALLYAGEYERKAAEREPNPEKQSEHYMSAARYYVQGALAACNRRIFDGRFDTLVYFAKSGRRAGQHVLLSEQFIRRGVVCYGKIGATTSATKAYGMYEKQMLYISGRNWVAQPETTKIVEDVQKQTGAYQFPETIATPYDQEDRLVKSVSA